MIEYPYVRVGSDVYPLIPIRLKGPRRAVMTRALVDSGARVSVFHAAIADVLGLVVETGNRVYLQGIGAQVTGYRHLIYAEIEGIEFALPVVFSREMQVSFNLLGREGFFDRFVVTLDEQSKLTRLIPHQTDVSAIPAL
jgi:hypothetical protein